MTAPSADCAHGASEPAASASSPASSGRGAPNINPMTGLSTDYLNHFAEAVMALEMAATVPECLDDLRAWQPKSYTEHFATSCFAHRDAVIRAYHAADPAVREALDAAAETLNTLLAQTRDVMIEHLQTPVAGELARRAFHWLRPLMERTAAVINGGPTGAGNRQSPQAAIDAMFDR